MPRTISKRPVRPGKIKSPDRRKKDNSCEFTAPKVPNTRMLEAGQAVQRRAILALKKAEEHSAINSFPKLQNNAKQASEKTQREHDLEDSEAITNLVKSGMSLESAIREVRPNFSETVGDQPQKEQSLIGELNHSQRLTNRINKWVQSCFDKDIDKSHQMPEEIFSTQAIGTFAINIRKIGKGESNRIKTMAWLDKENTAQKPPLYKSRGIDPITTKKLNPFDFFIDVYGEMARTNSIYCDELKALDPSLYTNLVTTVKGGVASIMPTKSDRVAHELASLKTQHPVAFRVLSSTYLR